MTSTPARIGILLSAAMIFVACSGDDEVAPPTVPAVTTTTTTEAPTTTAAATTTEAPATTTTTTTEPVIEPVVRMPLTGEPIDDASAIPDRPALAVKIDNHPRAKPQAGLNEADLVYEEVVEYGTRFAAVFHTQGSDPLGPIRSGRSQDVGILTSLDRPLFAWSGGNAGVRSIIRDSSMVDLDAGFSSGYYRRSGRGGAPHNLFSSTDALWASTPEEFAPPPQQFGYLMPGAEPEGETATVVRLTMGGMDVRWEYDDESGRYLRFERGGAHPTELSGQVSTDNLVVMGVRYQPSAADRRSPEAQTTGSGPVFVFTGGVVRQGMWSRSGIDAPYLLSVELPDDTDGADTDDTDGADADADGAGDATVEPPFDEIDENLIGLTPGRTWIELAQDGENFVTWE